MTSNDNNIVIQEKMQKLLKDPPEYTFSDVKRRELISRLYSISDEKKIADSIPFRLRYAYAAILASFLLVFGFTYMFLPVYPVVYGIEGKVKVFRAARKEWSPVQEGKTRLAKNDIVKTLEGGQADIIIPRVYHMRLKHDSEIELIRASSRVFAKGVKYNLFKGKVFTYFKKSGKDGKAFSIDTSQAVSSVFGTDFMVQAIPDMHKTWVGVLNGVVRVSSKEIPPLERREDASVFVEAGEKVVVQQSRVPTAPGRLMENELLEMEELYRIGKKPQVALLISTGKSRVRELLSATPLYISSEKSGILPAKVEEIARTFSQAIREGSKEKHIDSIRQFEEILSKYPNPKYDVQFLLFIGAYYGYLDEHNKSIETFQRVIDKYPKSSLTSIAQCAIGVIYEERLNAAEEAKTAYQKVISKYPRSPEIEEAQTGLKRLEKERQAE
ncbi:MAG: tetratricopeptide repeat protein [Candidatus Omnitrophota bacterium]